MIYKVYELIKSALGGAACMLFLLEAKIRGLKCGRNIKFRGRPVMARQKGSTIVLGDGGVFVSTPRVNPIGLIGPCVIRTIECDALINIGARVGISGAVICAASHISIGAGSILGSGVIVIDNDFHSFEAGEWINNFKGTSRPVYIGENVFIGARAIIMKGVSIGPNSVIGAGSVVTKNIPAGCVAAGNPAVVRKCSIQNES